MPYNPRSSNWVPNGRKVYTTINKAHPHNKLKAFLQRMKEQYRQLATDSIRALCESRFATLADNVVEFKTHADVAAAGRATIDSQPRHKLIEWLLEWDTRCFKSEWEKHNGWPFDDTYDQAKLDAHILAHNLRVDEEKRKGEVLHLREELDKLENKLGLTVEDDARMKEIRVLLEKLEEGKAPVVPPHEEVSYPDGTDEKDVVLGKWEDYSKEVGYEKAFVQVQLKDGTYDLEWRWPNAGCFGPHSEDDVLRVRYAKWKDENIAEAAKASETPKEQIVTTGT